MTEKRYKMINTNLVDDDGLVYYLIKKDGKDVVQVFGKHTAKAIVNELNALHEEKERFKKEAKHQQGQKQRLINYLKQYLNINKEINNIVNDDVWLDGDIND